MISNTVCYEELITDFKLVYTFLVIIRGQYLILPVACLSQIVVKKQPAQSSPRCLCKCNSNGKTNLLENVSKCFEQSFLFPLILSVSVRVSIWQRNLMDRTLKATVDAWKSANITILTSQISHRILSRTMLQCIEYFWLRYTQSHATFFCSTCNLMSTAFLWKQLSSSLGTFAVWLESRMSNSLSYLYSGERIKPVGGFPS